MPVTFNADTVNIINYNGHPVKYCFHNGEVAPIGSQPSEFDFVLAADELEVWLSITESTSGAVTVDWGDGTTPSGVDTPASSIGGYAVHTYAAAGAYTIRIYCAAGESWIAYCQDSGSAQYFDPDYTTRLIAVRCGDGMKLYDSDVAPAAGNGFSNQEGIQTFVFPTNYSGQIFAKFLEASTNLRHVNLCEWQGSFQQAQRPVTPSAHLKSFGPVGGGYDIEIGAVTTMPQFCRGMSQLEEIVIPDTVETIVAQAFIDCTGITSLTIPASVTTINRNAFSGCSNLASLTVLAASPPNVPNTTTITGLPSGIPIYVPAGSVDAYKAATSWSERASDIQALP